MKVLLIGASPATLAMVKALAAFSSNRARRPQIVGAGAAGWARQRPDWVLVATADQRSMALERLHLPTHRIIQLPVLASVDALEVERASLALALTRMAEIGTARRSASWLALSLAGTFVRCWKSAVERRAQLREAAPLQTRVEEAKREARLAEKIAAREANLPAKKAAREAFAPAKKAALQAVRDARYHAKHEANRAANAAAREAVRNEKRRATSPREPAAAGATTNAPAPVKDKKPAGERARTASSETQKRMLHRARQLADRAVRWIDSPRTDVGD